MQWLNKLDDAIDNALSPSKTSNSSSSRISEQNSGAATADKDTTTNQQSIMAHPRDSNADDDSSSIDQEEEVPHERLYVQAPKPISPTRPSPNQNLRHPARYPGSVKRAQVVRQSNTLDSDDDEDGPYRTPVRRQRVSQAHGESGDHSRDNTSTAEPARFFEGDDFDAGNANPTVIASVDHTRQDDRQAGGSQSHVQTEEGRPNNGHHARANGSAKSSISADGKLPTRAARPGTARRTVASRRVSKSTDGSGDDESWNDPGAGVTHQQRLPAMGLGENGQSTGNGDAEFDDRQRVGESKQQAQSALNETNSGKSTPVREIKREASALNENNDNETTSLGSTPVHVEPHSSQQGETNASASFDDNESLEEIPLGSDRDLGESNVESKTLQAEGSVNPSSSVAASSVNGGLVETSVELGSDSPAAASLNGRAQKHDSVEHSPSVPHSVEFRSEFDVARLLSTWDDDLDAQAPFDNGLNCYGVVHVRVLRAQRLPCPVGSVIQGVVALKPWKGRVRTQKARTFAGEQEAYGVCAYWDEDESSPVSMVHAYSSEESPVPSLSISLVFSPFGVFDFTMCSMDVSCRSLLRSPMVPKRQWLTAALEDNEEGDSISAIIEIEAMFEPVDSVKRYETEAVDVPDSASVDKSAVGNANVSSSPSVASKSHSHSYSPLHHDERSRADVSFSLASRRQGDSKPHTSTPHLLRLKTFWTPAYCCVCHRSIMSGIWRTKAFHCEECNVDCCSDCQLQVDIQLPCGSELAKQAVQKSVQQRLTLSNMLSVMAPVEESPPGKNREATVAPSVAVDATEKPHIVSSTSRVGIGTDDSGIGTLKLDFIQAHLFKHQFPADSERQVLTDLNGARFRSGDYYIRVATSGSSKTVRTRTIQGSGRPRFESGEMRINVPHYGVEFRVEVVDSATDEPVGATVLTTQSLLQEQRDFVVEQQGFPFVLRGPLKFEGTRPLVLELRTGVKTGFSSEFFASSSGQPDSQSRQGDIVGLVEVAVGLEEDTDALYGKTPYECPPRPPDELNMQMFQLHLSRISAFIGDFKRFFESYFHVVSWKNPTLTSLSLIFFVFFCFRFDPAYIGSVPVCLLVLFMLYLAAIRSTGHPKNRFVRREIDAQRKAEKVDVDYTLHRPVGIVSVQVLRGRNIRSPEHGLPGNVGCRAYWDPTRYASEKKRKGTVKLDKSATASHDIGSTTYLYTTNPVWERTTESEEAQRLKLLMSYGDDFFAESNEKALSTAVDFPILQPFGRVDKDLNALMPWSTSDGAIVVEVKLLNLLPGSDYAMGEVSIPFSSLPDAGELEGWFHVLEVGTTRCLPESGHELPFADRDGKIATVHAREDSPQLFLHIRWTPPGESNARLDSKREASVVLQEELVRFAVMSRQHQKLDLIGSSIGAINKFRGLSGNLLLVQNTLGSILDQVEALRNAFNFSDPFKSSVILVALIILWWLLILVPTRVIVLIAGLAQYGTTFYERYGDRFKSAKKKKKSPTQDTTAPSESTGSPATWILNAIRGLPTDEDLRKTYFWESRRRGALERHKHTEEKRTSRLQRLWRAQWYSSVSILQPGDSGDGLFWETAFALIQGHRFLWWKSPEDFDNGQAPLGRIFLAGHAGLATPSPSELRSIQTEDLPRVVCIFGRGEKKQERVTILASTVEVKETLEEVIVSTSTMKKD